MKEKFEKSALRSSKIRSPSAGQKPVSSRASVLPIFRIGCYPKGLDVSSASGQYRCFHLARMLDQNFENIFFSRTKNLKSDVESLPLLPRRASRVEQLMQIHSFDCSGIRASDGVRFRMPPPSRKLYMASAFLNRRGGGNPIATPFATGKDHSLAYADDELDVSRNGGKAVSTDIGPIRFDRRSPDLDLALHLALDIALTGAGDGHAPVTLMPFWIG